MQLIDSKYANRKVYYLTDIIEGRKYFAGEYDVNNQIIKQMTEDNPNGAESNETLLSHAILDVKDVIFPPRVEQNLYDLISYHDLVVIDSTVEEHDAIIPIAENQFLPDGTRATENMQIEVKAGDYIQFRHVALMQYRERVEFAKRSLDLALFEHEIGGVKRFTSDSTREAWKALIEIQKSMRNQNERIYVDPSKINYKDEATLREVSAFLIKLCRNVKIANNHLNMTAVKEGIIPTIGQLCFNYESFINTLIDIKRKFKEGDKLPIIYGKEIYFVEIVDSPEIPDSVDLMSLTEEDIQKYFYLTVRDVKVNDKLQFIFDDTKEAKREALKKEQKHELETAMKKGYIVPKRERKKDESILCDLNGNPFELTVDAEKIKRREVIFLPPAIAGMTTPEGKLDEKGMPESDELAHNYKNSIIGSPSMVWVDPNDFVYASTKADMSAGADFINICREQEQLTARRQGRKKEFVDLMDIFNSN